METTLHLVRHGRTAYNREGRVQGRGTDAPLDALGQAQAARVAERFAAAPLAAVYTSTLLRTSQTAAPLLALRPDLPVRALADLDEMSWGDLEGRVASPELRSAYQAMVAEWSDGRLGVRVPGGESPPEVAERALRAVEGIRLAHPGERVLAFTHGRLLRVLLCAVLPGYTLRRMQEVETPNASVFTLGLGGGGARLLDRADVAHLDGLEE